MEQQKIKHFMYVPFTGLGLYSGFRGNRFLKNRLIIFKQFVLPSLQQQTSKNFTLWISWRYEEKFNWIVQDFIEYTDKIKEFKVVHTFSGVCFYDDKYEDSVARDRLMTAIHGAVGVLLDEIGDSTHVLMTIQPSDDMYCKGFVEHIQKGFEDNTYLQGIGFEKGYIVDYFTKEVSEYNPKTNPPFYTIKFDRESFTNPLKHFEFTGIKKAAGKYPIGTPIPSHEYVGLAVNYGVIAERGFMVGCHSENISTFYNHPFRGEEVKDIILADFGIENIPPLKLKFSLRKWILRKMPNSIRRKLRYWWSEKLYNWIRS